MIDVVYPYYEAGSGWNGNELRFSLRSLEKHLKEDFRVWVIGDLPAWATEAVNHLPFDRFTVSAGPAFTNNANIWRKINLACKKFEKFILIADDQYLLRDVDLSLFVRPWYFQELNREPKKTTKWQKRLWATIEKLRALGLTTLNAECHTPFLVDSKRFLQLQNVFSLSDGTHLWKTAYLNYHASSLGVDKVPKRVTAFSSSASNNIFNWDDETYFLCHNNSGLTKALKIFIMTKFNTPAKFEKFPPVENKILGIGMPKTGTNSLTQALRTLGYRAKHYPHKPLFMGSTTAATDLPVANNFIALDKKYPKSKFILTVRDDASWKESSRHHFKNNNKSRRAFRHRQLMFNSERPTIKQLMAGKWAHEKKVLEYFKDRPEDLLILDIFAGEGYPELTQFLNLPLYDCQFPHENKRKEQLI